MFRKAERESEQKSREQKALNVCIFNIPESDADSIEDQYKEDVSKFKEILSNEIVLEKEDVKAFYRIGQEAKSSKPRPIILKLTNEDVRRKLLMLRNLIFTNSSNECKVFINPDRTKKEQEAHRKLLSELKERKSKGEENIVIRNGKIIEFLPFRRNPQLFWG